MDNLLAVHELQTASDLNQLEEDASISENDGNDKKHTSRRGSISG